MLKESAMRAKINLWTAALAAILVGLPLAERAAADDGGGDIVFSALSLAAAITDAAVGAS